MLCTSRTIENKVLREIFHVLAKHRSLTLLHIGKKEQFYSYPVAERNQILNKRKR